MCFGVYISMHKTCEDLSNKKFRHWNVLYFEHSSRKDNFWRSICSCCNEESTVSEHHLKFGSSKRCLKCRKDGKDGKNNLSGRVFGRLKVLERAEKTNKHGTSFWRCECLECNQIVILKSANLIPRLSTLKPCNICSRKNIKYNNLIGKNFGKLLVLREDKSKTRIGTQRHWIVKCSCGSPEYSIRGASLTSRTVQRQQCKKCSKKHGPKLNLHGQKFGKLTVVELVEKEDEFKWLTICECGTKKEYTTSALTRKYSGVKRCAKCSGHKVIAGESNGGVWKGYGDISGSQWSTIKRGAKSRNLSFEITIQQMWELFLTQNKKCALSGVELEFASNFNRDLSRNTASLDRIDSTKGYVINNVQWIHKEINVMKMQMSESKFIEWCNLISNYKGK